MRVNNVRPLDHRLHRTTLAQKSEPEMDDLMFNMDIEEEMTPIGVHRNFNTYHNTIDTYMLPMLRSDSKVSSLVHKVYERSDGSLQHFADLLREIGSPLFTDVQIVTSTSEGGYTHHHQQRRGFKIKLRHSFIIFKSYKLNDPHNNNPNDSSYSIWIADPGFKERLRLGYANRRYQSVIDSLPGDNSMMVLPFHKVKYVVNEILDEMEACFLEEGLRSVPPWRRRENLAPLWDVPLSYLAADGDDVRGDVLGEKRDGDNVWMQEGGGGGLMKKGECIVCGRQVGFEVKGAPLDKGEREEEREEGAGCDARPGMQENYCGCCGWREELSSWDWDCWGVSNAAAA